MESIVITLLGDDRAGLVDAVASVVAEHGANWERSHLAELAGKFAGIVLVTVPTANAESLLAALDQVEANGLLAITAERSVPRTDGPADGTHVALELTGQDHAGIVAEVSRVLTQHNVSIDELETTIAPAPQGGNLFIANAVLELPSGVDLRTISDALEAVSHDLMVDLEPLLPTAVSGLS